MFRAPICASVVVMRKHNNIFFLIYFRNSSKSERSPNETDIGRFIAAPAGEGHRSRGGEARVRIPAQRVSGDARAGDGEVDAGADLAAARVRGPAQHGG